jgi:8-oxo-dGTP pyrophosphatase MutT (NUDIX family)
VPEPDLSLARFVARLEPYRPGPPPRSRRTQRAAVAAILRFPRGVAEVLLMRRAEHPEDRWSGHVSFPGGRWDEGDADLRATVVRETHEEVGIDLDASARLLGALAPIRAVARGRILPMTIAPFVFHQVAEQEIVLNAEATGWFWLPLDEAQRGALDDRYEYRLGPLPLSFPCWRYQGHVIWGLTFQMLRNLLRTVAD